MHKIDIELKTEHNICTRKFWIEIYLCHSFLADCYPYNSDSHMILQ